MVQFVQNPVDFSVECERRGGHCAVTRENFLFFEEAGELDAVRFLHGKCGYVVLIRDPAASGHTALYHTSCLRMTDVIRQIFADDLQAPALLAQAMPEMGLGEIYRRAVTLPFERCRARVDGAGLSL